MEFQIRGTEKKKEEITPEELEKRMLTWPDCYYKERSAAVRMALLDEADKRGLTPEQNQVRRRLFALRYKKETGGETADLYMRQWMNMRFLEQSSSGLFSRKKPAKVTKLLDAMGFQEMKTEEEKRLLYQEIYHLAMLYIALCQEDKQFGSVIFGFGTVKESTLIDRIRNEIRIVAVDVPKEFGGEKECRIWSDAILAAYEDIFGHEG